MLALFGVSVQTGVIMLEYINQLRVHGYTIKDAAVEGAVLRLRPIMITMLVATLGLISGSSVARHRQRLAATLRHCDCWGAHHRSLDEHFPLAYAVRLGRRQGGRPASSGT